MRLPKLLAFDLDGTLLTDDKRLSDANRAALEDMVAGGARVALASGRLGSSMARYSEDLGFDIAMLTLNGAAVYQSAADDAQPIYSALLGADYADHLIRYAAQRRMALNYYHGGKLYAVRDRYTMPWLELYKSQTRSAYVYVESLEPFVGDPPFKALLLGDAATLDEEEKRFRAMWGEQIYIVRTWDYYLEFLDPRATKGHGLAALAASFGVDIADTVAFGDANNDIPMLQAAGLGIAMKNASDEVKAVARRVSDWTNQEDGVAREWERIKRSCEKWRLDTVKVTTSER